MESVATQLLSLLQISGIPLIERHNTLDDGSVESSTELPFPIRWLIAHRNASGMITLDVPQGECLAITLIEAWNVDYSKTATMAVRNSTDSLALSAQPLQTVTDSPALYVFRPGKAIFTFVFSALPLATARVQVHGFRLPQGALNNLGRIATQQLAF